MKVHAEFRVHLTLDVPDDLTKEQLDSLDVGAVRGYNYYDAKTKEYEYVEFEEGLEPTNWTQLERYEVVK